MTLIDKILFRKNTRMDFVIYFIGLVIAVPGAIGYLKRKGM